MPAAHTHEIVLRGRIDPRVLGPFLDDFVVDHTESGSTRLFGTVRDPAHLHGLVAYLASINAELIAVTPVVDRSVDRAAASPEDTTSTGTATPRTVTPSTTTPRSTR